MYCFFQQDKLQEVADLLTLSPSQISLIAKGGHERNIAQPPGFQGFISNRDFTPDSLIAGALESAFYEMVNMVNLSVIVCMQNCFWSGVSVLFSSYNYYYFLYAFFLFKINFYTFFVSQIIIQIALIPF